MRIVITVAFSAYPDGPERHFVIGEQPADLPEGWPELLIAKGLAEEVSAPAAVAP